MARRDKTPDLSIRADAPAVPPEWVPALEQPAHPDPANPLAVAGVVLAFITVVAAIAWGGWSWYAHSVVEMALAGVRASVSDDMRALAKVIPAATAATPAFKRASAGTRARKDVRFESPDWRGTSVTVGLTVAGERGSFTLAPSTSALGEADLHWTGAPFGEATGTVVLTDETSEWRVLYITVGKNGASFAPEDATRTFRAPPG